MEDLTNFFYPKSIAIVGSSENIKKVGGILFEKAIRSGLKIVPINISRSKILGKKCYPSILDFPGKVDLVVIAIPAQGVIDVLKQCGKKNITKVIIISAGFSEQKNIPLVSKLKQVAKKNNIKFIGTNCFGIFNSFNNLDLTFSKVTPLGGNIAFISQSGALWSFLAYISRKFNIGFSYFVSLGNLEGLSFENFIEYFSKDKKVKSICLYIERLSNGFSFLRSCKNAIARGKKIYVIKGGSSNIGKEAAVSHTASLASDYLIYEAVFRQAGIFSYIDFLEMFARFKGKEFFPKRLNTFFPRKAAILTNAGGAGVLFSDYLSKKGFDIKEKPLDILGTASVEDYLKGIDYFSKKDIKTLFVLVTPQSMTPLREIANLIVKKNSEFTALSKQIVPIFLGAESMESINLFFKKNKVNSFNYWKNFLPL